MSVAPWFWVGLFAFLLYSLTWGSGAVLGTSLFGLSAGMSHGLSSVMYAYCAILVWFLVYELRGKKSPRFATIVATLFAAHPVHANVVSCVSGWQVGVLASVILVALWFGFRRWWMWGATGVLFAGWDPGILSQMSAWDRIPTVIYFMGRALWLSVVPYPLLYDYSGETLSVHTWGSPVVWLTIGVYAGLALLAYRLRKAYPFLVMGIWIFLIPMFVTGLYWWIRGAVFLESVLFLPVLGSVWVLGWWFNRAWQDTLLYTHAKFWVNRGLLIVIAGVVLGGSIYICLDRSLAWRSVMKLAHHDKAYLAENPFHHYVLGRELLYQALKRSSTDERDKLLQISAGELIQATRLDPEYGDAYYQLGVLYLTLSNLESAKWAFEKAVQYRALHRGEVYRHLSGIANALGDLRSRNYYDNVLSHKRSLL